MGDSRSQKRPGNEFSPQGSGGTFRLLVSARRGHTETLRTVRVNGGGGVAARTLPQGFTGLGPEGPSPGLFLPE